MTISDICYQAFVGAGLRSTNQGRADEQWRNDFDFAKRRLDLILNSLPMDNAARVVTPVDITCVADQQSYSLATTILDVVGDGMYMQPGETAGQASGSTFMKQITYDKWLRLSEKSTSGQPTLFWVDRSADTMVVYMWQTPSEAGTVRLHGQRKLADSLDGSATLDLEEFWDHAIVSLLEAELAEAKSLPLTAIRDKRQKAQRLKDMALAKANPRPPHRARVSHATPWNRRAWR